MKKKLIIFLGMTLLFTSVAANCETQSKLQTSDELSEQPANLSADGTHNAEEVIESIKDNLDTFTDCGFLREQGPWLAEFDSRLKFWLVSVESTDPERRSGSYSWKYFEWTEAIVSQQEECYFVNTGG